MSSAKLRSSVLPVGMGVVVLLGAWYFLGSGGKADDGRDSRESPHALPAPTRETKVSGRPAVAPKPSPPREVEGLAGKEKMSFEEIKRRWLALRAIDPSKGMSDEDVAEREKLAIESLRSLKLSAGAFELDAFLIENEIPINRNGAGLLPFHRKILEEDPAFWRELKDSLMQTLHGLGGKVAATDPWGSMAAILADYGTDLEFEEFYQDLKGPQPELAKKALLMRGSHWLEQAPEKLADVMDSTLQRLGEVGGLGGVDSHALVNLVSYNSPVEQYERTLEVLEEFSLRNAGVNLSDVKNSVVSKWARRDPVGVTEMVLSDRSLYSDDVMQSAGGAVWLLEKEHGTEAALQWLSSIPDEAAKKSAIRGAALSTAAGYLEGGKGPEHVQGLEKALQISNLLSRKEREEVFHPASPLCRDYKPEK